MDSREATALSHAATRWRCESTSIPVVVVHSSMFLSWSQPWESWFFKGHSTELSDSTCWEGFVLVKLGCQKKNRFWFSLPGVEIRLHFVNSLAQLCWAVGVWICNPHQWDSLVGCSTSCQVNVMIPHVDLVPVSILAGASVSIVLTMFYPFRAWKPTFQHHRKPGFHSKTVVEHHVS